MGDAWDDEPIPMHAAAKPVIAKPRPTHHLHHTTAYTTTTTTNPRPLQRDSHSMPSDIGAAAARDPTSSSEADAKDVAAVLNTGKVNIKIKKRDSNHNLHRTAAGLTSGLSDAQRQQQSAEQREADYERLRAQIFADQAQTTPAPPAAHNNNNSRSQHRSTAASGKPRATGHVELLNSVVAGQRRAQPAHAQSGSTYNTTNQADEYRRDRSVRADGYDSERTPQHQSYDRQYDRQQQQQQLQYNDEQADYPQRPRKPNVYNANDFPTLGR